ncbi:hypothetical protein P4V41_07095 [Fictibacillus nanhaiensis]|uniref:hypothetical protein n=1 Tax=Fictibacillus nanhaiensis TaxID=742169 RepID=UPI002E1CC74E|nr:hypothetical protein [Fictibacillus nanhaiensis]
MSNELNILIKAVLDENLSQKSMQDQLDKISGKLDLKVGLDIKEFEKVKKNLDSLQQQLGKETSIKLINEKDLTDTKKFVTSIEEVKKQFKDLGTIKVNKSFDPVTNDLKEFNVEIRKADGLVERLKYQLAQLNGIHGIKDGFIMTNRSEVDNTSLQMEKALQKTIESRQKVQKASAIEQDRAINKNIEQTHKETKAQQEMNLQIERELDLYKKKKQLQVQDMVRRYGNAADTTGLQTNLNRVMSIDPSAFQSMKDMRHWQSEVDLGFKQIGASVKSSSSHVLSFGEAMQTAMVKFPIN